jgi:3',5'-nucleoside bisphosphate phosphatase
MSRVNTDLSVDLHSHTTASDGSFTPRELVAHACERGLAAVGLTDHDTIDGIKTAREASDEFGVEVIAGIEISAQHESPGVMHVLGYLIDDQDERLLERVSWVQARRNERNPKIIERLNDMGVEITLDDVKELAGAGQVGRPHIAQVLVDRGVAESVRDAFNRFLHTGCPAYVEKVKLSPADSIEVIRSAGGAAVLAHPYQLHRGDEEELKRLVEPLVDVGLSGIECYYPEHTSEQTERLLKLAGHYSLVVTGGSDFHGKSKPDVLLGGVNNGAPVPYDIVDQLRERVATA